MKDCSLRLQNVVKNSRFSFLEKNQKIFNSISKDKQFSVYTPHAIYGSIEDGAFNNIFYLDEFSNPVEKAILEVFCYFLRGQGLMRLKGISIREIENFLRDDGKGEAFPSYSYPKDYIFGIKQSLYGVNVYSQWCQEKKLRNKLESPRTTVECIYAIEGLLPQLNSFFIKCDNSISWNFELINVDDQNLEFSMGEIDKYKKGALFALESIIRREFDIIQPNIVAK